MYGAGVVEEADERLAEKMKARRTARAMAKNLPQDAVGPQTGDISRIGKNNRIRMTNKINMVNKIHMISKVIKTGTTSKIGTTSETVDGPLRAVDEELEKARRRRASLEEELRKVVAEEKTMEDKRRRVKVEEQRVKELEMAKLGRERKQKIALARKAEASGGKPAGITKPADNTEPSDITRILQQVRRQRGCVTGTLITGTCRKSVGCGRGN